MTDPFTAFAATHREAFRRIARATKHEYSPSDLHGEAWLVAHELGEKRGKSLNFCDPQDADAIFGHLYVRIVRRRDWRLRSAESVNELSPDGWSLAEVLPAPASSDPLTHLLLADEERDKDRVMRDSFSEAIAYIRTNENLRNDRAEILRHLGITAATYLKRVHNAGAAFQRQPSLFDRKAKISKRFCGRCAPVRLRAKDKTSQDMPPQLVMQLIHTTVSGGIAKMQRITSASEHYGLPITRHIHASRHLPRLNGERCADWLAGK